VDFIFQLVSELYDIFIVLSAAFFHFVSDQWLAKYQNFASCKSSENPVTLRYAGDQN